MDRLTEVTEIFDTHEVNEAIGRVLGKADVGFNATTDYGEMFRHFKRG